MSVDTPDVSWPLGEQLVVDPGQHATDDAIDILKAADPDQRVSVQRVLEYARGERSAHDVPVADWIRVIDHSDGRLAIVSWTSAGITEIGRKRDADDRRPYEIWMYSGLRDRMGDDPIQTDDASSRSARQLIEGRSPAVVPATETHLRPEIVTDGGVDVHEGAKFCGIDPADHIADLEFVLQTFASNPMRSTISSAEVADALDLRKDQATTLLSHAQQRGLVERWSAQNHEGNPKWMLADGGDLDADR